MIKFVTEEDAKELHVKLLDEEMVRLRKEDKSLRYVSDAAVRSIAAHNLTLQYQELVRGMMKQAQDTERSTVGDLFGKTRKQILDMNKESE